MYRDRGIFESRPPQKEKPKTRLQQSSVMMVLVGLLFYPFVMVGGLWIAPFIWYHIQVDQMKNGGKTSFVPRLYRYEKLFWWASVLLLGLNVWLFMPLGRGYLSVYQYFPLQQIGSPLTMGLHTIIPLWLGSFFFASLMMSVFLFYDKQKVESMEQRRRRMQKAKRYLERQKVRFQDNEQNNLHYEEAYAQAASGLRTSKTDAALLSSVYIGRDEYGEDTYIPEKELNQHTVILGTTGSGKTTALENFLDYCAKKGYPALIIDGKGSPETRQSVETYATNHKRPLKIFSDTEDLRYNPIKYGNSIVVRDKLISMAQTESVYYSTGAEKLLQLTIQLMDQMPALRRDFKTLSRLFNPQYVLTIFDDAIRWDTLNYERLYHQKKAFFDKRMAQKESEKETAKKKRNMPKEKEMTEETAESSDHAEAPKRPRGIAGRATARHQHVEDNPQHADVIREMLQKMPIYQRVKLCKHLLTEAQEELFYSLFEEYETSKEGIFELYERAGNLRANVDLLFKSEIGYLFDTSECEGNELDLLEVDAENAIVYIALDGLIYKKFIESLAHFFIGEINFLASYRYKGFHQQEQKDPSFQRKPFFLFCDEPTTYLSENLIDTVNKTRGAGIHTIYSPQTVEDLRLKNPQLAEILIGNTNTFLIGRLNDPAEAEYICKLIGTYTDVDMTEVVEQEAGYGKTNRINWTGEKGSKRNVSVFKIHPDTIKELRTSEFILYRKASANYVEPRKIYVRKP